MQKLKIQGETYELDDSKLNVEEARAIKTNTELGVVQWSQGLLDGDPDALCAMVWLAKKRAGEAPKWADVFKLDLDLMDLMYQIAANMRANAARQADGQDDDQDDEPEPDPTPPAVEAEKKPAARKKTSGRTPTPGSPST